MKKTLKNLFLLLVVVSCFSNLKAQTNAEPDENMLALIFVGANTNNPLQEENDARLVYQTLTETYGYTDENITVYYTDGSDKDLDGESGSENDGIATRANLEAYFAKGAEYFDEKNLFVFIAGDGNAFPTFTYFETQDPMERVGSDLLQSWVRPVAAYNITFLFATPKAADFKTKLSYGASNEVCKNRNIQIISADASPKQESWITQNYQVSEYVFYWAAAANGFYPKTTAPSLNDEIAAGSFDFSLYFTNHPGDFNPDANNDGVIQLNETFNYADKLNTWSDDGYFYQPQTQGETETSLYFSDCGLDVDLATMKGIGGTITSNVTTSRPMIISDDLVVGPNVYFHMDWYTILYFNNATMLFDPTASLLTAELDSRDYSIPRIKGDGKTSIVCYNSNKLAIRLFDIDFNVIQPFNDMVFRLGTAENSSINIVCNDLAGWIWNTETVLININCNNFYAQDLVLNQTSLTLNCGNFYLESIFTADDSKITVNGNCYAREFAEKRNISNCIVSFNANPYTLASEIYLRNLHIAHSKITVIDYKNFTIENSHITSITNALEKPKATLDLINCGWGQIGNMSHKKSLKNNEIRNLNGTALRLYNTNIIMEGNCIKNSKIGVECLNRSSVEIIGNSNATNEEETQQIIDNELYNVYVSSELEFPTAFRYNSLHGDGYSVYCPKLDEFNPVSVENNYWGESFRPEEAFYPYRAYSYLPIWNIIPANYTSNTAENNYLLAASAVDNQDYTTAENKYKEVVTLFPEDKFAKASLKALLALEEKKGGVYNELKNYYAQVANNQTDSSVIKLCNWLANYCNIKTANYTEALNWYDAILQNPETLEDSIFAAVDIAYIYQIMQGQTVDQQPGFAPAHPELYTRSLEQYNDKRDDLLSQLHQGNKEQEESLFKQLHENVTANIEALFPNPMVNNTTINIEMEQAGNVSVKIYNVYGSEVYTKDLGLLNKGRWCNSLNIIDLPNGIYFCTVFVNNQKADSVKLIIEK